MMPRTVNRRSPSAVPSGTWLLTASPFFSANSFVRMIESGCARKTSGSSMTASSRRIEIVVAQAAVAGHVDAKNQQAAFAGNPRVDNRFDHRHGDAHRRRRLDSLEDLFVEAGLAGAHLQLGFSGDPIDGRVEAEQHALIGRVHADEDRHAQHDPADRQQRPQHVLSEVRPADEAQEDHRATPQRRAPHVLDDAAVAQRDGPRAALGDLHVVRDDDDR